MSTSPTIPIVLRRYSFINRREHIEIVIRLFLRRFQTSKNYIILTAHSPPHNIPHLYSSPFLFQKLKQFQNSIPPFSTDDNLHWMSLSLKRHFRAKANMYHLFISSALLSVRRDKILDDRLSIVVRPCSRCLFLAPISRTVKCDRCLRLIGSAHGASHPIGNQFRRECTNVKLVWIASDAHCT